MMDNGGRIAFWNEAAQRIFGYAEQEATEETPENSRRSRTAWISKPAWTLRGGCVPGNVVGKTLELAGLRWPTEIVTEPPIFRVKHKPQMAYDLHRQGHHRAQRVRERIRYLANFDNLTIAEPDAVVRAWVKAINLAQRNRYEIRAALPRSGSVQIDERFYPGARCPLMRSPKAAAGRIPGAGARIDTVARIGRRRIRSHPAQDRPGPRARQPLPVKSSTRCARVLRAGDAEHGNIASARVLASRYFRRMART